MSTGTRLAGLLLLTTSLTFPAVLHAQSADPQEVEDSEDDLAEEADATQAEEVAEQPETGGEVADRLLVG